MTDQIKISEVSDILRKELEGINTGIQLEEVGTVLQVSDGVVRIYGLDLSLIHISEPTRH